MTTDKPLERSNLERAEPVVRLAAAGEAPAVLACVSAAFEKYIHRIGKPPAPMLLDYPKLIQERSVWVAELAAGIEGVLVQYETPEGFYIDTVASSPRARGTGVGRALLQFAEREATRRGHASVYLCTNSKMTENQVFYPSIGYVEYERKSEAGYDRVYYRKGLTQIIPAATSDVAQVVDCLVAAFAEDPITGFLLQTGSKYQERLTRFFSLLVRARLALGMPVLVARAAAGIQGASMGNAAAPPPWPSEFEEEWGRLEIAIPGFNDRAAIYDEIAGRSKPPVPHYYLGVIGMDPAMQGLGIGTRLLKSFCDLSASDELSSGVYLETANPSNVRFYERAGFAVTGQGSLGSATLWCMFLSHNR